MFFKLSRLWPTTDLHKKKKEINYWLQKATTVEKYPELTDSKTHLPSG